mmetsp:Transcript_43929/g.82537  ORF Transcript_43929/g.82537 Transcript_43929/m.82537 type:complete len:92 (-) Transcript_43929:302-577(-)
MKGKARIACCLLSGIHGAVRVAHPRHWPPAITTMPRLGESGKCSWRLREHTLKTLHRLLAGWTSDIWNEPGAIIDHIPQRAAEADEEMSTG